jgi:hypothetical protein
MRPTRRAAHGEQGALRTDAGASPFKETVGPANDGFEREADRVADAVARGNRTSLPRPGWAGAAAADTTIQRKCAECEDEEEEKIRRAPKESALVGGGEPAPKEPPPAPAAPALLVDDEGETGRGQMRKSEFMTAVRAEACSAVDAALTGTGRDSQGCPYIDYWFGYYEGRSASQIERSLRRYAPEAIGAATARDYIRIVAARIRRSAQTYAKTGEIPALPEDVPMPGAGGPLAGFGGMFFKARRGGAHDADPVSVRAQLRQGQPLPGAVRARMEPVFGRSFDGVQVHTDATGADLSDRLNAKAFTVGRHVAFGRGEFQPGTIAGDALIAHELAHVVQQGGAMRPSAGTRDSTAPLERDADRSAMSAVSALWSGARGSAGRVQRRALPALHSGLALSRCTSERQKEINRLGDVQLGFMEKRRKEAEEKARKDAEADAQKKGLPPPPPPPKKELGDIAKEDAAKHGLPPAPAAGWAGVADKPKFKEHAKEVIARVVASVKGTEVEPALEGLTIVFTPEEAIAGGFYGLHVPDKHEIHVSLSWIQIADVNPKDVWENIVHEGAGHRTYGVTYSWEITMAALRNFSDAERKKITGDPKTEERRYQQFYEAYGYPETEIYASLWQRRYQHPEKGPAPKTGGIDTDTNIVDKLNVMKSVLEPSVMLAVLKYLKKRVDENKEILARDKKFYVDQVKAVLNIDL